MEHAQAQHASLNRTAFDATVHCLTGCAIGEVLGLVIATAIGLPDLPSIVLSIVLAFRSGRLHDAAADRPRHRAARSGPSRWPPPVSIVTMETRTP